MHQLRCLVLTPVLVLGFALSPATAHAQKKLDDIKLTPKLDTEVNEMKKGEQFNKTTAAKTLGEFMAYFAEKLQHPEMFKAAQDFGVRDLPMEGILNQFTSRVLVPVPGDKFNINQADYITYFGEAFVTTFKPILETNADRIVRLNAARLMAVGAACGAPAFGPLITNLISNANTPAEVKFWAFKAAEALLSAYDITKLANASPRDHTLRPAELAALLKVLEANIFDPTKFVTFPQGVDPKQPTAELGAVVSYIRRQAVRALARVRFAAVDDGSGKPLRPAFTLARVAMSDPALIPAPGPTEVAEAVIGICGMQPDNDMMMDAAADAVATGLITFAGALTNQNVDPAVKQTTAWKLQASRLRQALLGWKSLVANAAVPVNRQPQAVTQIADEAIPAVLAPLEASGAAGQAAMKLDRVIAARQAIRATASKLLFRGDSATSIAKFQN